MATEAASGNDPRQILANAPMGWRQIVGVALCALLNALDGFDVLSISFASPGIAKEWDVSLKTLGFVLSMEIFGMAAGSILLGRLTDKLGRVPTMVLCLVIMAVGMLAAPLAYSVPSLAAIRLFTGLGIGGMLAATNAVAAEYTNARWRTAGVALMAAGYPLGAIVGGTIASKMLVHGNWRDVFYLGAGLALILLPIVPLLMPEPVGAILHRRPAGALEKINRTLRAFGHAPVDAMPPIEDGHDKNRIADLFSPQLIAISLLLLLSYFSHILTFYFVLKWAPKIVVGMGFTPAEASGVLVLANVGGLIGAIIFSLAALRVPLRSALIVMMVASTVLVALFGQSPADLSRLSLAAAAASFCTNGVIVGFYALIAQSFPTPLRGTGTGFVIGVGRLGAAAGPIIAGYLFEAKLGLPIVAIFMSVGSLAAAAALFMMPHRENVAH